MDRNSSQHCLVSMAAGLLAGALVFVLWAAACQAPLGTCLAAGVGVGLATGTLWALLPLLRNSRLWLLPLGVVCLVALGALLSECVHNPALGIRLPFFLFMAVVRWALRDR